jgi:glycosyltransferase involved in cell wall biosynthesis
MSRTTSSTSTTTLTKPSANIAPDNTLVSIIVPVYNVEQYLDKCVKSIFDQSYSNFELILVNDCSPDNSQRLIDGYMSSDSRVRCIKHKENQGLAATRNTGLKAARGEYIYFLDSDDFICSTTIESLVASLESTDGDFAIGRVVHWYPDESDRLEEGYLESCQKADVFATSLEKNREFIEHVVAWHKLIRRTFLIKHNILFQEHLTKHEDNPFTALLYLNSTNFSYVREPTLFYRQRRNPDNPSIMESGNPKENAMYKWLCLKEILGYVRIFNKKGDYSKRVDAILAQAASITEDLLRWIFLQLGYEDSRLIVKDVQSFCREVPPAELKAIFPKHYFLISMSINLSPEDWLDFLHRYYKNNIELVDFSVFNKSKTGSNSHIIRWLKERRQKRIIMRSKLFDERWYLKRYDDVRRQDINALKHFIRAGAWEGRSPNKTLDLASYIMENHGQLDINASPIIQYIENERPDGKK